MCIWQWITKITDSLKTNIPDFVFLKITVFPFFCFLNKKMRNRPSMLILMFYPQSRSVIPNVSIIVTHKNGLPWYVLETKSTLTYRFVNIMPEYRNVTYSTNWNIFFLFAIDTLIYYSIIRYHWLLAYKKHFYSCFW